MDKQQIKAFLKSNPTEEQKQQMWDRHLQDVGFKNGMLMCCCGCYGFGWGKAPENGVWYLSGHKPDFHSIPYSPHKAKIAKSRKVTLWNILLMDLRWIVPILFILAIVSAAMIYLLEILFS